MTQWMILTVIGIVLVFALFIIGATSILVWKEEGRETPTRTKFAAIVTIVALVVGLALWFQSLPGGYPWQGVQ